MKTLFRSLAFAGSLSLAHAASVSVMEFGEVRVRPDVADLVIRIETTRPTVKAAMDGLQIPLRAAYAECARASGDTAEVGAGRVSVEKEMRWVKDTEVFRGWKAAQEITVRVRDVDRIGPLLEAVSAIKGARVGSMEYTHSALDSLRRVAEAQALDRATRSARGLAAGMGKALGEARVVRNFPPDRDHGNVALQDLAAPKAFGAERSGSAYQVTPDRMTVQAMVSAEFELGPTRRP